MEHRDALAEWAQLLKTNWEERARSRYRDFYVASHPGWGREEVWRQQALHSAAVVLEGLDEAQLLRSEVLEIGCGVGRLAFPSRSGRGPIRASTSRPA